MELITLEGGEIQSAELNTFEQIVQGHEKKLKGLVVDVEDKDSLDKASKEYREMRKDHKQIDTKRLELKKELEKNAQSIHKQGLELLSRLDDVGEPIKKAIDDHKSKLKAIEDKKLQDFNDACQWLRDCLNEAQFSSTEKIKEIALLIESKSMDNTGLDLTENQKLEYAKVQQGILPKIQEALGKRIALDAEEERQREAAMELQLQQEEMRKQREELELMQQKERERVAAKEAAEQATRQAEQKAKAEADRLEREKQEAIDKAERDKQEAIEAERKRIEDEQAAEAAKILAAEKEAERKAANRNHQKGVNNKAKAIIMKAGVDEETAKEIILQILIARDPSISINY